MTSDALDIDRLMETQLSPLRMAGFIALAAVGLLQFTGLTVLLATEPTPLPTRTVVSLGAVAAAGLAWAVFAVWRLMYREPLLLRERVISSSMATLFASAAAIGGVIIAATRNDLTAVLTVAAGGAALIGWALTLLTRSISMHRRAKARLVELQRQRPARHGER